MKYKLWDNNHPEKTLPAIKMSEANRGKSIRCKQTGKKHPLPISHEGLKYYHLSKSDVHDFVLKKDYEII